MFGRLAHVTVDKDKPSTEFLLTEHASESVLSSLFLSLALFLKGLVTRLPGWQDTKKKRETNLYEVVVELK